MDNEKMVLTARYTVLFIVLVMSLYFDIKENRIKNFISIPAALAGFLFNFYEYGISGLISSSKGLAIPFALLIIFYFINVMGAGDIKLFAAMGALMGPHFVFYSILISICVGAVIAILLLISRRQFLQKIMKVYFYLLNCFLSHRFILYTERGSKESKFPFSVAVVPSVLIYLLFGENIKVF